MKSETRWLPGCTTLDSYNVCDVVRFGSAFPSEVVDRCEAKRKCSLKSCDGCTKEPVQFTIRYEITKEKS